MRAFFFVTFILFDVYFIVAQSDKQFSIHKTTEIIKLDGILNEGCWSKCEKINQFWQNFPYDTSLAKTQTEAFVCYDDNNLYIAAVCHDTLKGKYVIQSLKRDFSYPVSDAFVVTIDPFSDKINGFSFGVNPYGVQREGLVASGGGQGVSTDWDNKWFSFVKQDSGFWCVEMQIPFKTLRFKNNISEGRINLSRNDLKRNENSTWVRVPRQFNISSLAFTGKMRWDEAPIRKGSNIAIIPYAIGRVSRDYISDTKEKWEGNAGADAKIAVTTGLNLDLTLNPDFSQVEVDRQVTNLTRFSLFFPERRQFFIENSDLFAQFGFRQIRPFFSRMIGLKNGNIIPIYGGFRLSGKPNKNWRIGIMDLQTAPFAKVDTTSGNYFVAAAQRNLFNRSNLAFILVNKENFSKANYLFNHYHRLVGVDFNLASANNRWMGKFFFHHSLSPTKNENAFAHASFLLYNSENLRVEWNHEYVDENYNAEAGFVPRQTQFNSITGKAQKMTYWRLEPQFQYWYYPKNSIINKTGPQIVYDAYYNKKLEQTDEMINLGYFINFTNSASFAFHAIRNYTKLLFPTDITFSGQREKLDTGKYYYTNYEAEFKSNQRKTMNALVRASYGTYFTGTKTSYVAEINMRLQPYAIISLAYTRDEINMPYLNKAVQLDLIGPKIELSFTKSLFFTTFLQYNSQINNFNINARFQWRFRPMSDVYIVYTDNYNSINFGEKNRALVVKFVYWLSI
jgi:hypothetical protein